MLGNPLTGSAAKTRRSSRAHGPVPRPRPVGIAPFLALTALLVGLPAPPAGAGKLPDASIFVHLVPVEGKVRRNCYAHGVKANTDVVVHGEAGQPDDPREYLAYVLVAGIDTTVGMAAVQFGIAYDPEEKSGVDVLTWNDCALYEWHLDDWPQAGTGNLLTWDQEADCQTTEPVVIGFFHIAVHGPDQFKIIPRPVDDKLMIAACGLSTMNNVDYIDPIVPENRGWAGFGSKEGKNPWKPAGGKPVGGDGSPK